MDHCAISGSVSSHALYLHGHLLNDRVLLELGLMILKLGKLCQRYVRCMHCVLLPVACTLAGERSETRRAAERKSKTMPSNSGQVYARSISIRPRIRTQAHTKHTHAHTHTRHTCIQTGLCGHRNLLQVLAVASASMARNDCAHRKAMWPRYRLAVHFVRNEAVTEWVDDLRTIRQMKITASQKPNHHN
jgi:hypothetical protein